jgi:glycogen debranching enzyme
MFMRRRRLWLVWLCWAGLPWLYGRAQQEAPAAASTLTWATDAAEPQRFVAVHGREAAIFGYSGTGLEVWAYPLQLLSDYRVSFVEPGVADPIPGGALLRRIEYRPAEVVRVYVGPDFVVREDLFVPLHEPGVIVSYTVEGRSEVSIRVHFQPSLNLMWPGALGGQSIAWNSAASGYVEQEPLYGFSATIASPQAVAHDAIVNRTIRLWRGETLVLQPRPAPGGAKIAKLYIGLGAPHAAFATTAQALESKEPALREEAAQHDDHLLAQSLQITTPDDEVNRSLAWAELALDQAWVCNPKLGCGEVAGYGPSRPGRRPQYDWFFAGDGLVAVDGLLAAGDYQRAREELAFITKYQEASNGMIWHELSQSAGWIDWEQKYPYMYVHVDITFQYLAGMAEYAVTTGDRDFVVGHWKNIEAAYLYCLSLIDPDTHLPQIPAGKEGENEQVRMRDDIGLSSEWISAADGFAALAKMTGHAAEAAQAAEAAEAARKAIAAQDWDRGHHFWLQGHAASGEPVYSERPRPSRILLQGVFSQVQAEKALDQLASPEFETDWGTRSLAADSLGYDPNSYAAGSVSALGSANLAETFWKEHRPQTAFEIWDALLAWNTLDSEGHLHEVLAGDFFHPEVESVPEQTWSSAGYLSSAVHGLFGIGIQSETRRLMFAPHLPGAWKQVNLRNLRLGESMLDLHLQRNAAGMSLEVENDGPPVRVEFAPEIPLGAAVTGAAVNGTAVRAAAQRYPQEEDAELVFSAAHGITHCEIRYSGGVEITPETTQPAIGDKSRNLKIVRAALLRNVLHLDAFVTGPDAGTLLLSTKWRPMVLQGAELRKMSPELYRLRFIISEGSLQESGGYREVHAEIRIVGRAPQGALRRRLRAPMSSPGSP